MVPHRESWKTLMLGIGSPEIGSGGAVVSPLAVSRSKKAGLAFQVGLP